MHLQDFRVHQSFPSFLHILEGPTESGCINNSIELTHMLKENNVRTLYVRASVSTMSVINLN